MENPYDQFDQAAATGNPYDQFADEGASTGDKIIGSRPGRFALGASTLFSGPLQLGAHLGALGNKYVVAPVAVAAGAHDTARHARDYASVVADAIDKKLKEVEDAKKRGMKDAGTEGIDFMGMAGAAVPAVLGAAPTLATTLPGRMAQGAGLGSFFGATSPVSNGGQDFWSNKAGQTAVAGALGGVTPLAVDLVKGGGKMARDTFDVLTGTDAGVDRLKRAYYERLVGKKDIPAVVNALDNAKPQFPGDKLTSADAMVGTPAGTAIQAQQRVTAQTSGGPSALFNARAAGQNIAKGSSEIERDIVTKPLRDAALARATNINTRVLNNDMLQIVADPQIQAVTPAKTFLEKIAGDAINAGNDPHALYSVRKYIDDLVNKRIDSPENVAGFASTKLLAMKKVIDEAIENGGAGKSWGAYLSEYAKRSRAIDAFTQRTESMYSPAQQTAVPGGSNIAESTSTHLPNMLSRSAMMANYIARALRNNVEPKIDASMAQDMLNPQTMADVMRKLTPQQQSALAEALKKYGAAASAIVPAQNVPQ